MTELAFGLRPREQRLRISLDHERRAQRLRRPRVVSLRVRGHALVELRACVWIFRRSSRTAGAKQRGDQREARDHFLSVRTGMNGESAFHVVSFGSVFFGSIFFGSVFAGGATLGLVELALLVSTFGADAFVTFGTGNDAFGADFARSTGAAVAGIAVAGFVGS